MRCRHADATARATAPKPPPPTAVAKVMPIDSKKDGARTPADDPLEGARKMLSAGENGKR